MAGDAAVSRHCSRGGKLTVAELMKQLAKLPPDATPYRNREGELVPIHAPRIANAFGL